MDYPALDLGHKHASRTTLALVDLDVHIWGLDEIAGSNLPVGVVIASHGRCNKARDMEPFARGMLGEVSRLAAESGRRRTRDLLVITLDHRNHGERLRHKKTNLAYDKNPHHFVDMAATVYGACQDHDFVIRFLEPYLWPNGERKVVEWMATGISLGGNSVWRMLREDPRITIAAPIIGLPFEAFATYLGARAVQSGLSWGPPTYPKSLVPLISAPAQPNAYQGKKILSIHGAEDQLVSYRYGSAKIAEIQSAAPAGDVEVFVQEGRGHKEKSFRRDRDHILASLLRILQALPIHRIACNAFPGLQKIRHTASMLLSDFDGTSAPPGDADEASRRSL
ncbi:hypothetical protein CcaverHIS631_0500860 [Cutaneotrichosporon cavernicola]|nr:hypothetical protein CcaverHIS631_0500860 [Cutaneotrichosporon cavernicola]BEJ08000.1 hypothetical protein CcaverHIS641_0500850 [Cutaneotrichosporon cavernicola]